MSNKKVVNISDKIIGKKTYYEKMEAERLEDNFIGESKEVTVKISYDTNYNIIEHTSEKLKIKAIINIGVDPKAIFQIHLEMIIDCKLKEPIDIEITEDIYEEIVREYGSEVSLLIGTITERLLKKPLILPPIFSSN